MDPLDDETYMAMLATVTNPVDVEYINRHYSWIYYKKENLSGDVYSIVSHKVMEYEPIIDGYTFKLKDMHYLVLSNGWIKGVYEYR